MKSRRYNFYLVSLFALCLAYGCEPNTQTHAKNSDQTQWPTDRIIATVNGIVITQDQVDQFIASKKVEQPNVQQNPAKALEEMISMEVLKQHAQEAGIHERPEIISQLSQQRSSLLINTFLREYVAKLSFSDEQLKSKYDQQILNMDAREYKARHILTKSKEDATQVINDLNAGANFIAQAKAKSTGPSGPQGGDLGWFTAESMVRPFAQALKGMEKGSYNREPVKTQFGWHVILVEDQRNLKAPSFEEIKEKLRITLTKQALQAYVEQLREDATVELKSGT